MPQQPNMQQLLKQAQKMQEEMLAAQESLKDEVVEASAGGGMVTVQVTGDLASIDHDRSEAIDPEDAELLRTWCWPPSTRRFARRRSWRRQARRHHRRPRRAWASGSESAGL